MAGQRKAPSVHVSNEAVLRWLQRTGTFDVEQVRQMLASALDKAVQAGAAMGAEEFIVLSGGMVFVVRSGVVTTVTQDDGRHSHARLLARRVREAG
jgi:hypothetical protein